MYDKELILNILRNIDESLEEIVKWMESIKTIDDFLTTPHGTLVLNGVCMKILVIGEELKSLDKRTNKQLLSKYKDVMNRHIFCVTTFLAFNQDKLLCSICHCVGILL